MFEAKTSKMHYLPVSILRHFTNDEGILHVYYIQEKRWRERGPRGIGFEHDMYSLDVDKWFQREIESPAGYVFKKLREGDTNLSNEERLKVARFISTQVFRTPLARKRIINEKPATVLRLFQDEVFAISTLESLLRRHLTLDEREKVLRINFLSRNNPEQALQEIQSDENSFTSHLQQMVSSDRTPTHIDKQDVEFFMRLAWRVIKAEVEEFILSDNPVVMIPQGPPGFDDPQFECVLPISKKVAIHLGRDRIISGQDVEMITSDRAVKRINSRTLASSYQYIFSSRKDSWISKNANRRSARHPYLRFSRQTIDVQYGRPPCLQCGKPFNREEWDSWEGEAPLIRGRKGVPPHSSCEAQDTSTAEGMRV